MISIRRPPESVLCNLAEAVLPCFQDFPELIVIRAQLAGKYGKEYLAEASSDLTCRKWRVNENLIR